MGHLSSFSLYASISVAVYLSIGMLYIMGSKGHLDVLVLTNGRIGICSLQEVEQEYILGQ